jgi:hypothetical protein
MATWLLVRPLVELTDQLNARFPKRDKKSDGTIGDQAHASGSSSHNPDKTGKPEWRDGDSKNEVRAKDIDKDLKDTETNTTMEHVVQEWVRLCRNGKLWWVRYIIYNGRIWHQKDGYKTRVYTGKNKHKEHAHVTNGFSQKADDLKGTDWGLKTFRLKPKPAAPYKPKVLQINGGLNTETIKLWQYVTKQTVNGKLTPTFVKSVQTKMRATVDHRIVIDGDLGPKTIAALQRYLKSPVDGIISKPKSNMVAALQRRLNTGTF